MEGPAVQFSEIPRVGNDFEAMPGLPVVADGLLARVFVGEREFASDKIYVEFDQPHPRFEYVFVTGHYGMWKPGVLEWGHEGDWFTLRHRPKPQQPQELAVDYSGRATCLSIWAGFGLGHDTTGAFEMVRGVIDALERRRPFTRPLTSVSSAGSAYRTLQSALAVYGTDLASADPDLRQEVICSVQANLTRAAAHVLASLGIEVSITPYGNLQMLRFPLSEGRQFGIVPIGPVDDFLLEWEELEPDQESYLDSWEVYVIDADGEFLDTPLQWPERTETSAAPAVAP